MDHAVLVLRLVVGAVMAAHGSQKLFGWFGGYGLSGTGGFFETLGFRPGRVFAFAAGFSEFAGGLLLVLGFLGPVGPALIISVMTVAAIVVHWRNGLFAQNNGIELPLLYFAAAIALALSGFGQFSIDSALGLHWTPAVVWTVLFAGLAGGLANLAVRRAPAAQVS